MAEATTYPLACSSWDEAEFQAIEEVIASGTFTMGERVAGFERAFGEYVGAKYCVMVNSGSSANLLMVAALFYSKKISIRRGDEVIVPAVSWATTYYPLHQYGLKLKFVDIDRETLNYDLAQLEGAVTDDTRIIMAVNLLGNPNDVKAITQIIDGREIIFLEDNCESLGAEFEGKKAGTFGLMGSNSFFFSHHMSTMEGGMVVTGNEELYHILLSLRAHGWTRDLPKSSWFGFSLVLEEHAPFTRSAFSKTLRYHGIDCRPIVAGNFTKNEVMKWFDYTIHKPLLNADYVDAHGLFIGNHHFLLDREFEVLNQALRELERTA
jgi:dTDP-4-amino-4,6-dideoxygalactose transaminase